MRLRTDECVSGRRAPPRRCAPRPATMTLVCVAFILAGPPLEVHCLCPDIVTDIADGVAAIARQSTAGAPQQPGFNVTDSIVYSCNHGYHVMGMPVVETNVTLSCQDNNQWNGTVPTCIIVNCGQVFPNQANTLQVVVSGSGETFGSTRTLRCRISGYHVIGLPNNMTEQVATCQANGEWSETSFPGCALVECSDLHMDLPADANLTAIPPYDLEFTIYTRLLVTCPPGAYVNTTNTSSATVYCANVGVWKLELPPFFSRIPLPLPICTLPPAPSASSTTGISAGSIPPTGAPMDCDDPAQLIVNASVEGVDFSVNSRVTVVCEEGLYISGDASTGNATVLQCGENGEWMPRLPACSLAPEATSGSTPASSSPAITSGTNLPRAAGSSTDTTLLTVAIALPSAVVLLFLTTLAAICWRRRQLRKRPCEPWPRSRALSSSQHLTLLEPGQEGQATSGPAAGSQVQENGTSGQGCQSELFDNQIYGLNSSRSFAGHVTEDNYRRIQANTVYSSPVSPTRSSLGSLPSPPRDLAPDPAGGQSTRADDAMALYNRPIPNSPPLYHEVTVGSGGVGVGDEWSGPISPYSQIGGDATHAPLSQESMGDGGGGDDDAEQHSYNTVRQPPRRRLSGGPDEDFGGDGLSSVTTTVSPLYFCLENVSSPLLDEEDNALTTDGDDDDGHLAEVGVLRSTAAAGVASQSSAPSSTGESSDGENRRPSKLMAQMYSVPDKAQRSRSRAPRPAGDKASTGNGPKDTVHRSNGQKDIVHRSNRRTLEELDEVSSAAASMLRRQRSRSMPATERKERRRLYLERLHDIAHDSDPSSSRGGSRPKPSFPFPPPPRRDSMATGKRALTATTSHPTNITPARSLSVPRQRHRSKSDGQTAKRKNKDPGNAAARVSPRRNILLDDSMLELTTDL